MRHVNTHAVVLLTSQLDASYTDCQSDRGFYIPINTTAKAPSHNTAITQSDYKSYKKASNKHVTTNLPCTYNSHDFSPPTYLYRVEIHVHI